MRLPWSIRAGVVGGALVALAFLVYWMARAPEIRRVAMDRMDRDLVAAAHALSAGLGPDGLRATDLDARVKAARREGGLRYTVIAEGGRVIADSEAPDIGQLANHATRSEVVAALRDGSATSRRTSDSVNRELRYAAVRIPGTGAVARAALDAKDVDAVIEEETRIPWGTGLLATLVASIVAGLLLAPTAAGVRGVAHALSGLEQGDLTTRVPVRGPDFLRGLSLAFNSMAGRLQSDVDRVNAERARLATVLDGLAEGVFAIDAGENVGFLNRAARVLLGVGADDKVEGRPIHHLVRDPQLLSLVRLALTKGESHEAEIVWDGAPKRLLHVRATPVGGGGPGAILLVGDVSTIRRLERMRSDFVANVSHEFRTPLSAIAGAAETLLDGAMGDSVEGPRFVEAISRQADRLKALVDDLLTLSRLESAPEGIERVPVDFGQVVRQGCEAVAARAREGELRLEVHADGPLRVLGDPEALRRLVDNLVVNAVTYTPAGGWVRVALVPEEGRAVLTVADSGIGIPAEHIERIFERFYRVDKARSRSKGGTGLGLAIVKHSVNLHGGEISVQSRPGAGSTFTVSVPLPKDADLPASST